MSDEQRFGSYLHHNAQVFDVVLLRLNQLVQNKPEQRKQRCELENLLNAPALLLKVVQYSHPSSHGLGSLLQLRVAGLHRSSLLRRRERGEAGVRSRLKSLQSEGEDERELHTCFSMSLESVCDGMMSISITKAIALFQEAGATTV